MSTQNRIKFDTATKYLHNIGSYLKEGDKVYETNPRYSPNSPVYTIVKTKDKSKSFLLCKVTHTLRPVNNHKLYFLKEEKLSKKKLVRDLKVGDMFVQYTPSQNTYRFYLVTEVKPGSIYNIEALVMSYNTKIYPYLKEPKFDTVSSICLDGLEKVTLVEMVNIEYREIEENSQGD